MVQAARGALQDDYLAVRLIFYGTLTTKINGRSSAYWALSDQQPGSGRSIAVMIIGPVFSLNAPDARSEVVTCSDGPSSLLAVTTNGGLCSLEESKPFRNSMTLLRCARRSDR